MLFEQNMTDIRVKHIPIPECLPNRLSNRYDRIVCERFFYHEKNLLPTVKKRKGRVPNRPGHNFLIRLRELRMMECF